MIIINKNMISIKKNMMDNTDKNDKLLSKQSVMKINNNK